VVHKQVLKHRHSTVLEDLGHFLRHRRHLRPLAKEEIPDLVLRPMLGRDRRLAVLGQVLVQDLSHRASMDNLIGLSVDFSVLGQTLMAIILPQMSQLRV
jgi:hypothetical protein